MLKLYEKTYRAPLSLSEVAANRGRSPGHGVRVSLNTGDENIWSFPPWSHTWKVCFPAFHCQPNIRSTGHSSHRMRQTLSSALITPAVGLRHITHTSHATVFHDSLAVLLTHFCTLNMQTTNGQNTIIKSVYWHESRSISTSEGLLQHNAPRV